MRYQYTCCTPSRGYHSCRDVATPCNHIAGRRVEYLDRHDVACGEFEAIQSWSFGGHGCNTMGWGVGMRYHYKCCKLG